MPVLEQQFLHSIRDHTYKMQKKKYNNPIVLFDGVCNLCNGSISYIIKYDKKNIFKFASLQSDIGQSITAEYGFKIPDPIHSIILIYDGQLFQKSEAVLLIGKLLGRYRLLIKLVSGISRFISDKVYDFIANHRYSWFGKTDACMVPTPDLKSKFL